MIISVLGGVLASCATYVAKPLSDSPDIRLSVRDLAAFPADFPLRDQRTHRFDPGRPLDIDDVAILAVANNPDLRAARAKNNVAEAQVFAAGILPNPQLNFDYGFFIGGPGTNDAMLAGLAQDVVPLLTLSARRAAAEQVAASVRLDVAWQEWQIVSRARLLFVDAISLAKQRRLIADSVELFKQRYDRSYRAMQDNNEVIPTVTSDLVALSSAESQLSDIDQFALKNEHDLNALLGLAPEAKLRLETTLHVPAIDVARLQPLLMDLTARRPDLLALKAGYQSQEEKLRRAIIEQFPKVSVGPSYGRDPTDIRTVTLGVSINLPIFDRNQGNIAVEGSTRQQLAQEYQARLDAAYGAAKRLLSEIQLTERQYRASQESVRRLQDGVEIAEPAFQSGNLDERTYVDLRTSLLAKKITVAKQEQLIWEQRVALQTLIGSQLPSRRNNLRSAT